MLYQFKQMIVSIFMAVSNLAHPMPAIDMDKINETACLSQAIYKEAGNQSMDGKIAVANVIMNRTHNPDYPSNVCAVIKQKGQFSFLKDIRKIKTDDPGVQAQMEDSIRASLLVMNEEVDDNTNGATSFVNMKHTRYKKWTNNLRRTKTIGSHTFFKSKD